MTIMPQNYSFYIDFLLEVVQDIYVCPPAKWRVTADHVVE